MTTATKVRRGARMTVPANELAAALRAVAPAVNGKHPVLSHVLVGDGIAAYNGELRIVVEVGNMPEPVLIPHGRLAAIVSSVHGEVEIERGQNNVTVTAARGKWVLPTVDVEEFPADAVGPPAKPFARIPADQFCRCVAAVIDATDSDSSRFALGGVLLEHKGPDLAFVTSDGRRLHATILDLDQATDDGMVIVPKGAMATIAKLAGGAGDDAVQIGVSGSDLVVELPDATVRARLLDGRFPRWLDVIPKHLRPQFGVDGERPYVEPPPHAEILAGELLAAVRQASIVTSETSKGVLFVFVDNGLMLTSRSADYGEATVTADLSMSAIKAQVKLDPAYVAGWLRSVDEGATVEVYATDAESAVVLRHEDQIGVVMPLAAD